MPAQYDKSGIRFAYPDNWDLIEGDGDPASGDETLVEVTVRSPATAFWSLTVYPGHRDAAPMLEQVLQAMQAEYPDLEHETFDTAIGDAELTGVELHFVCLDFTNTALAHVYHHEGNTHLLLRQAEDREWDTMEPVLRAVTMSMLSGEGVGSEE